MRVKFVVPPVVNGGKPAERSSGCTSVVYPTPNIYELTVAGCVIDKGHEVTYTDCINDSLSLQRLIESIKGDNAEVLLMWCVNLSLDNDIEVCQALLAEMPHLHILLLGPAPTLYTDKSLCHSNVIVVRGEPELTVIELLQCLQEGHDWHHVEGLSFLSDGKRVNTPMRPLMKSLDDLPMPARHLVGHITYRNAKLKLTPYTTMVTSRNCPFQCIYCVPSSLTFARELEFRKVNNRKPPISFLSVEKVNAELKSLHEQGYRAIGFMDDNFIWNAERTAAICQALRRYDMVWGCQARVDAITDEIAQMLGESNCRYVDLGVESFNDEILRYIKKGITSEQIYEAIHLLQKHHVPVKLNVLIGTSPIETEDTIKDTIRKAKSLHVDQLMINIVAPFPGTKFYEMAKANGWIENGDYVPTDVQRNSILNYPHLTSQRMETLLFRSNISYFLSPRFVLHHIRQFNSIGDFIHALKALKVKLFG